MKLSTSYSALRARCQVMKQVARSNTRRQTGHIAASAPARRCGCRCAHSRHALDSAVVHIASTHHVCVCRQQATCVLLSAPARPLSGATCPSESIRTQVLFDLVRGQTPRGLRIVVVCLLQAPLFSGRNAGCDLCRYARITGFVRWYVVRCDVRPLRASSGNCCCCGHTACTSCVTSPS